MTEEFQTFNEFGDAIGLETRDAVHRKGLWHRSSQIYLFDPSGMLLLQQRSDQKDLYAGLWADSVGEHLKPEESHRQGAYRGLYEELKLTEICLHELGEGFSSDVAHNDFIDREFKQAYLGLIVDKEEIDPDPAEVKSICWVGKEKLRSLITSSESLFCPSFLLDLERLDLINQWDGIVSGLFRKN